MHRDTSINTIQSLGIAINLYVAPEESSWDYLIIFQTFSNDSQLLN